MSVTYSYDVPGVMCAAVCGATIERALDASTLFAGQTYGVYADEKNTYKLTIILEDESLSYLDICDLLNEVIGEVGFECVPLDTAQRSPAKKPKWSHRMQGFIGLLAGLFFMLLPLLMGPLPLFVMGLMAAVSVPLTLFLGIESYRNALKKLKFRTLTMDTLFSVSTLTILLVSSAAFFFPVLPMMFDAGLLIFGFRHVGLAIDEAFKRTQVMTQRFQDDAPENVCLFLNNKIIEVPLASIKCGDQLVLSAGAILPVDGIFEAGEGLLSDLIITGTNKPRDIKIGERLYAGTQLLHASSPLLFRARASAAQSHLARLDAKITRAKLERAPLETATTRILQYFTPVVIGVALLSGALVVCFFSWALAIKCVALVLVSACPCTLGLLTPLAVKIGIKKSANYGVLFNSAEKLEAADNIQCVVFDLNGTLTEGKPHVVRYRALPESGLTDDALLGLLAHFERDSVHPTAKALCALAQVKGIQTAVGERVVQVTNHAGLVVEWAGCAYTLGSESMMRQQGIDARELDHLRQIIQPQEGDNVIYLARAGRLMGYVVLHDRLREDAVAVIATLKSMGKVPHLCTGADRKTALLYARRLGIAPEHVRADCVSHAQVNSEQSKKQYVDELKAQGFRVAAVGDAANDAEMLVACDVGFAVQSEGADERTQQEAAALIRGNALFPVVQAFVVAQQTVANIKQNLIFSLFYNIATMLMVGGLLLTLGIVLNPAVGAALMIVQTSLILLNVYRFAKQPAHRGAMAANDENIQEEAPSRQRDAMRVLALKPVHDLSAVHRDADVLGHGNGVRLTHAHREGGDTGKGLLDQRRNLFSHSFDEGKSIGLDKQADLLAEGGIVNRIG